MEQSNKSAKIQRDALTENRVETAIPVSYIEQQLMDLSVDNAWIVFAILNTLLAGHDAWQANSQPILAKLMGRMKQKEAFLTAMQSLEGVAEKPLRERMKQAVAAAFREGLCWSSRAWAVVYRVYQMKGYQGGYRDFVREVAEWGLKSDYKCNYDAVQKPVTQGILDGTPDKWKSQGAQGQAAKLAYALLKELG